MFNKLIAVMLLISSTLAYALPKVLIVGDCLCYPYRINPEKSWVNMLGQKLAQHNPPYELINKSLPGNVTAKAKASYEKYLDLYQPKAVFLEIGGNDGLQGLPLATIEQNLRHMILSSKKRNVKVLFVLMQIPNNYGVEYEQNFKNIYERLALEFKLPTVSSSLDHLYGGKEFIQKDGLHPSEKAQFFLVDLIWPELEKLLS